MRYGFFSFLLAVFTVLTLPAFADDTTGKSFVLWSGTAAAKSCVTAECHADLGRARYVHPPVAEVDCEACHTATDQPHPGDSSMQLVEDEPGLCLQCHDNPAADMAYPHSALEEGCSGCHNPHQGSLPKFLAETGGKLCLECHEDVTDGKFLHGPVKADNCQMCHGVHGGNNESMLNLPGKENCLACHPGIRTVMDKAVSQHEPVANGVCWDCHAPHAADFKPQLKDAYTEKMYAPYASENFALCFGCHDENAFLYERTSEATGFRNRDQNLHYFHVNRPEKGRSCRTCHGVHGADQDKLLVSRVPGFGDWQIPLSWISEGEKATCYVGCHRPKSYDRLNKIKNP